MMEKTLTVTLYTLKPLDQTVRGEFDLPALPYHGNLNGSAKEYLRTLGVIHYRDDQRATAVVLAPENPPVPVGESIVDKGRFRAYRSVVVLNFDTLTPMQWRDPVSRKEEAKLSRKVAKEGDRYAWLKWNEEVFVHSMDETSVRVG